MEIGGRRLLYLGGLMMCKGDREAAPVNSSFARRGGDGRGGRGAVASRFNFWGEDKRERARDKQRERERETTSGFAGACACFGRGRLMGRKSKQGGQNGLLFLFLFVRPLRRKKSLSECRAC